MKWKVSKYLPIIRSVMCVCCIYFISGGLIRPRHNKLKQKICQTFNWTLISHRLRTVSVPFWGLWNELRGKNHKSKITKNMITNGFQNVFFVMRHCYLKSKLCFDQMQIRTCFPFTNQVKESDKLRNQLQELRLSAKETDLIPNKINRIKWYSPCLLLCALRCVCARTIHTHRERESTKAICMIFFIQFMPNLSLC